MNKEGPSVEIGKFFGEGGPPPSLVRLVRLFMDKDAPDAPTVEHALYDALAEPGWAIDLLSEWLRRQLSERDFVSPARGVTLDDGNPTSSTAIIIGNYLGTLEVRSIDPHHLRAVERHRDQAGGMNFAGTTSFIRVLGGALDAEIISIVPLSDETDFSSPIKILDVRKLRLEPESPPLRVDGRSESLIFTECEGVPLCLSAHVLVGASPVSAVVENKTGRILSIIPTKSEEERIRVILSTIRLLAPDRGAVEICKKYLRHPSHFVRWHALRELAGLTGYGSMNEVHDFLAGEKNPVVRRAAGRLAQTLKTMESTDAR